MNSIKIWKCLPAVLLAALFCFTNSSAFAQFTSSVQGTVTDPAGSLVPGAAVTLANTETNIINHTTSNEAGVYRFLSLPPGPYVVTVNKQGFQEARITTQVSTEESAGVDVKLQIAQVGQTVSVSAEAQGLNPDETRLEETLSTTQLENIPSQSQGTLNFLKLAPGVTGIAENTQDASSNRNYSETDANGMTGASNLYTLDGVPINSAIAYTSSQGNTNGGLIFTPALDTISEITLQTTTFNVDYGTTASMQVGMSTKSGTNKFHGDADYTYSDKIMNALTYGVGAAQSQHDVWDSFAGGGPIVKDHTFVFGSYGRTGNYGGLSSINSWWTPTFQTYIATADPNSIDVTKFMLPNPASRLVPNGSGVQTGQDVFGSDCGTPAAFNTPCGMDITEAGSAQSPNLLTQSNYSGRVDQYLHNSRDRIFVYYFAMNQLSNSLTPNPTWDGQTPTNGNDLTVNYTHTFSPNLLNSATFAYTNFNFGYTNTPHSQNQEEVPFVTSINDNGSIGGFAEFTPFWTDEAQYYGRDVVLWTHGRHSLSLGVEASNNWATDTSYVFARPFINSFNTTEDFLHDQLDSELVLSHYSALTGSYLPSIFNGVATRFGLYAEDSWQVTPRLLVNFGIRWDDLGNPAPYSNSLPWVNSVWTAGSSLSNIAQSIAAKPVSHAFSSSRDLNILPRAGFAWTPVKNMPGTVVRGGVGLYQDIFNLNNFANGLTSDPPDGALTYDFVHGGTGIQPILSYGTQGVTPPYGFVFPTVPTGTFNPDGSPVGSQTNITGTDSNLPVPKTVIWNLAVEQQLPSQVLVSINYSGSHSYNQMVSTDLNRPAGNYYCDTPGTGCSPANHLVNSDWNAITPIRTGEIGNYDALIARIRQNWRTLMWQSSYTWSHSLSDPTTTSVELQYNPHAQYGSSNLDVRQRITSSFNYEIPVSHNLNRVVSSVAGGWNLGGEVIAQTGAPFTVYYDTQDFSETGLGGASGSFYSIPDYTGKQRSGWSKNQERTGLFGSPTLVNGINPLFPAPGCTDCIGNSGQNGFRNDAYFTWDQSIVKKIQLPWFFGEKGTLSIRGEAFNLPNRTNFFYLSNNQVAASNFGISGGAYQARTIQVGTRFEF